MLSFEVPAGRHERFAPEAAESMVGQETVLNEPGKPPTTVRIVSAEVVRGGAAVRLIVEPAANA